MSVVIAAGAGAGSRPEGVVAAGSGFAAEAAAGGTDDGGTAGAVGCGFAGGVVAGKIGGAGNAAAGAVGGDFSGEDAAGETDGGGAAGAVGCGFVGGAVAGKIEGAGDVAAGASCGDFVGEDAAGETGGGTDDGAGAGFAGEDGTGGIGGGVDGVAGAAGAGGISGFAAAEIETAGGTGAIFSAAISRRFFRDCFGSGGASGVGATFAAGSTPSSAATFRAMTAASASRCVMPSPSSAAATRFPASASFSPASSKRQWLASTQQISKPLLRSISSSAGSRARVTKSDSRKRSLTIIIATFVLASTSGSSVFHITPLASFRSSQITHGAFPTTGSSSACTRSSHRFSGKQYAMNRLVLSAMGM